MNYLEVFGYIFLAFLPFLINYLVRNHFQHIFFPRLNNTVDQAPIGETTQEINVKPIENPFTINLDTSKSNCHDGLYIDVFRANKLTSFNMITAWRVDISKFYDHIEQEYNECFYKQQNLFLSEISQHIDFSKIDNPDEDVTKFHFKIPQKCKDEFIKEQTEDKVKSSYPIVLCIYHEKENLETKNQTDIIASIYIIHLKDKKMSTKILYNYNKRLNNQIIVVNKMFEPEQDDLCVVCKCERSNVVLLPCIHKCLCKDCFKRCSKQCPICRTKIVNIFHV